jgi:hypothetical protein
MIGIVEYWKNGIMGPKRFENNSLPQYSNIPSFHHSMKVEHWA